MQNRAQERREEAPISSSLQLKAELLLHKGMNVAICKEHTKKRGKTGNSFFHFVSLSFFVLPLAAEQTTRSRPLQHNSNSTRCQISITVNTPCLSSFGLSFTISPFQFIEPSNQTTVCASNQISCFYFFTI